jgi:hypothetical protein
MREFTARPAASREDYDRAFQGLEFPASRPAILRTAADRGGLDTEVLEVLGELPDTQFPDLESLKGAVREMYWARGSEPPL